ncbi:MAG: mevalonate kinase [Gammaproteobacteria bacterium]|nr:mevalonate kinase [Gammaproteobacteria bacterium]
MYFDFETTTYGKWILAGEHAVLRGHGALVFPLFSKSFTLKYQTMSDVCRLEVDGNEWLQELFKRVLTHGLGLVGRTSEDASGLFHLENTIPIGVGMGASAALCVAVARWFVFQQWVSEGQLFHFATELEHLFHGKSSGLDIVGVSATSGQFFKNGVAQPLVQHWQPRWLLSSCGQKSITAECIFKVQQMWEQHADNAVAIDKTMSDCVEKARKALVLDEATGWPLLVESMNQASLCFREWDLINEPLDNHMQALSRMGATVVKPTGSGGGGYVLSLWKKEPMRALEHKDDDWVWIGC